VSFKNILAIIGGITLIIVFRTQIIQIMNLIASSAAAPQTGVVR
jgi:hypothetical protein